MIRKIIQIFQRKFKIYKEKIKIFTEENTIFLEKITNSKQILKKLSKLLPAGFYSTVQDRENSQNRGCSFDLSVTIRRNHPVPLDVHCQRTHQSSLKFPVVQQEKGGRWGRWRGGGYFGRGCRWSWLQGCVFGYYPHACHACYCTHPCCCGTSVFHSVPVREPVVGVVGPL